jgi:tetratricopeptide (TPR) repeat protein
MNGVSLRRSGRSISLRAMSLLRTLVLLLCLPVAGCRPGSIGQSDDQKDPYFLAGKNRLQGHDYEGAIDMFEKALDVNPRSAAAHFELGVLYEQQQSDYAASLYHYQRAVMLNSNASFAELSRQRMQECKRELAKSVVQPISMDHLQRELDSLRAENQQLKQTLREWQNYYASRGGTPSNLVQSTTNPPLRGTPEQIAARTDSQPTTASAARTNPMAHSSVRPVSKRVHTITAGETPASIARRYNVKLSALQSANPTMDAKRLRPGQTLIIPAP